MSFGRKGVAPGASGAAAAAMRSTGPRPMRPAAATPDRGVAADDPFRAQREAFLAAERARKAAGGDDGAEDVVIPYPGRPSRGYGIFGDPAKRSLLLAYVFWNFSAPLGMHRFYCGETETAWYQLALFYGGLVVLLIWAPMGVALLGAWFLWILLDLFLMPGMMRRLKEEHRAARHAEVFG